MTISMELIVNGTAVLVAVVEVEPGVFRATVQGDPRCQAHGSTMRKAAEKAALLASYSVDNQAA